MGLFDSLSNSLGGLISNAVNSHPGGLSGYMQEAFNGVGGLDGVVTKLNEAGLGSKVNSWLGRGDNIPITTDEIRGALSNEHLKQIAAQLGVPVDQVAGVLAEHLPNAVDQASPNGALNAPT